jgi:hypothetical protein
MEESFSAAGWLFVERKEKKRKKVIAYGKYNRNNFFLYFKTTISI